MRTRSRAADSYNEIEKRITEIQTERMQAIAGCVCPSDLMGQTQHANNCPLRPQLSVKLAPSAMQNKPVMYGRIHNVPRVLR